jgi:hypothetical protein
VADARDVAIIGASRPRRATAVRSIASGIARWQAAIERRRRLALVRRAVIAGLLSACLLELGAVASGRAGAGPWLLPAILVGLLGTEAGDVPYVESPTCRSISAATVRNAATSVDSSGDVNDSVTGPCTASRGRYRDEAAMSSEVATSPAHSGARRSWRSALRRIGRPKKTSSR